MPFRTQTRAADNDRRVRVLLAAQWRQCAAVDDAAADDDERYADTRLCRHRETFRLSVCIVFFESDFFFSIHKINRQNAIVVQIVIIARICRRTARRLLVDAATFGSRFPILFLDVSLILCFVVVLFVSFARLNSMFRESFCFVLFVLICFGRK